jgi:hypothetical protein
VSHCVFVAQVQSSRVSRRMWETKKAVPIAYSEVFQGLEGIPKGLRAIENRETWGKVIVRLRDEDPSAKL